MQGSLRGPEFSVLPEHMALYHSAATEMRTSMPSNNLATEGSFPLERWIMFSAWFHVQFRLQMMGVWLSQMLELTLQSAAAGWGKGAHAQYGFTMSHLKQLHLMSFLS